MKNYILIKNNKNVFFLTLKVWDKTSISFNRQGIKPQYFPSFPQLHIPQFTLHSILVLIKCYSSYLSNVYIKFQDKFSDELLN